jgi:xylulose-5-phosphate/fructose-6-phosphate phosphoketolase
MPGEVIDTPNPQALPSHIPDVVEQLQVKLELTSLEQPVCDALFKFRRAASYIAAGEIAAYTLLSYLAKVSQR